MSNRDGTQIDKTTMYMEHFLISDTKLHNPYIYTFIGSEIIRLIRNILCTRNKPTCCMQGYYLIVVNEKSEMALDHYFCRLSCFL